MSVFSNEIGLYGAQSNGSLPFFNNKEIQARFNEEGSAPEFKESENTEHKTGVRSAENFFKQI